MISYAQNQEDVILARAFEGKINGFYIDIGACFPQEGSVTKHFYDLGWRGINVEPDPQAFEMLAEERSKDINLNVAITDVGSELRLYHADSIGETSALVRESASSFVVPALSLRDLCEQHVNNEIDFLKIDVEGFEFQVVQSGDWQRYRPKIIIAEVTFPWSNLIRPEAKQIEAFLLQHSYEKVYFDGLNYYFVAFEAQDLAQKIALQPNTIDNFVRGAEAKRQEELTALHAINSDLNARNQQLATEMESVRGATNELQETVHTVTSDLEAENKQLANLKTENKQLTTEMESVRWANNELQETVELQRRSMQDLLNSRSYRLSQSLRTIWVFLRAPINGVRVVLSGVAISGMVRRLARITMATAPNLFIKIRQLTIVRRFYFALLARPSTTVTNALNRAAPNRKKTNFLKAQSADYTGSSHGGNVRQTLYSTARKWQLGNRIDG
jgi:FkbM family methyltransferase